MSKKNKNQKSNISIKNRKATFEYLILEKYIAGLILKGSEVKSLKKGQASINESYCYIKNKEIWIKNMHISKYDYANVFNHEELRERKLLLKKKKSINLKS